jgi:hypothetical protein
MEISQRRPLDIILGKAVEDLKDRSLVTNVLFKVSCERGEASHTQRVRVGGSVLCLEGCLRNGTSDNGI